MASLNPNHIKDKNNSGHLYFNSTQLLEDLMNPNQTMFETTKKMVLMFEEIKGMINAQLETLSQITRLHSGENHQSSEKQKCLVSKQDNKPPTIKHSFYSDDSSESNEQNSDDMFRKPKAQITDNKTSVVAKSSKKSEKKQQAIGLGQLASEKGQKKKRRSSKKPKSQMINGVRKPSNPFMEYLIENRAKYRENHPELSNKEVILQLSSNWKTMDQQLRKQYEVKYQQARQKYNDKMSILPDTTQAKFAKKKSSLLLKKEFKKKEQSKRDEVKAKAIQQEKKCEAKKFVEKECNQKVSSQGNSEAIKLEQNWDQRDQIEDYFDLDEREIYLNGKDHSEVKNEKDQSEEKGTQLYGQGRQIEKEAKHEQF